jgi:NDP-sugar pyrophosphorylase family protein
MGIERVTITIKKDLLRQIDSMIDGRDIKNRSHAFENLVLKSLGRQLDTVLILAGGTGSGIPKPLISIHGKPILEHQINFLKKHGIKNIFLSLGPMHEKIRDYFGNGYGFGVEINYLIEKQPLGTAGSIALLKDHVNHSFAILNVDTLMDPNIEEVYEFHKKEGSTATALLVTADDTTKFGVAKMRGNRILGFVSRPSIKSAPSRLVHAGFCIFEPEVISIVPKGRFMIEELFQKLAKTGAMSGFVHDGPIYDVGTDEGYSKAINNWKDL